MLQLLQLRAIIETISCSRTSRKSDRRVIPFFSGQNAVGDLCSTANRFARLANRSMLGRFDEALHPRIERGRSERAACACTAKVALRIFVFRGFLSATVFRDSFKLRMPVEFADALRAFTPVRNNFHEKAEKNFSIEK